MDLIGINRVDLINLNDWDNNENSFNLLSSTVFWTQSKDKMLYIVSSAHQTICSGAYATYCVHCRILVSSIVPDTFLFVKRLNEPL